MKLAFLGAIAWLGLILTAHEGWPDGTRGGGAQIEAAFRLRAVELIRSIADSPKANALCAAEVMSSGLRSVKIRIVDELIDPATGKSLTDKNLDAWTSPGDMQLLKPSWAGYFDPSRASFDGSVDTLVLHEVYRSTGTCDDDKFQISDQILSLLTLPTRYAQVFAVTTSQPSLRLSSGNDDRKHFVYCDAKPEIGLVTTCAFLWPKSEVQQDYDFNLIRGTIQASVPNPILQETFSLQMRPLAAAEFIQISNLLAFASEQNPFFIVFDLQYGLWAYGFDLTHLIKLP